MHHDNSEQNETDNTVIPVARQRQAMLQISPPPVTLRRLRLTVQLGVTLNGTKLEYIPRHAPTFEDTSCH